jgi:uncharacterized protein
MIFICFGLTAKAEFIVPELTSPVVDEANIITGKDERALRDLLYLFKKNHQAQVQILTVRNLGGASIEQAAIQVVDQWKIGDKLRDDGLLILVAAEERKIRIEVGQGLEGIIPDVVAKRIVSDIMIPVFRQSSASQGIVVGTYQILLAIDPNFKSMEAGSPESFDPDSRTIFQKYEGLFILIFIAFFFILNIFGPRGPSGRLRRGLGGWGGAGMGGGFGGGFGGGGGGWSGGGGGFSGGGASGNW